MSKLVFTTKRLTLRPVNEDDFDWLASLWANPMVMKNIYSGEILNSNQAKSKHQGFIQHWEDHGFGCFVILNKENNEHLGYCGFRYFESDLSELDSTIEIGYIFDEPSWGKGYASEVVQKAVQIGFESFHFDSVFATVTPQNIASRKVLEKSGLSHIKNVNVYGVPNCLYGINLSLSDKKSNT